MNTIAFNLLLDQFFPITTVSGKRRRVAFLDLRQEDGDYPVAFDWPRGDFNIAAFEFSVSILALACQPEDHDDWAALWKGGGGTRLEERVTALAPSFNLVSGAGGPLFMQDYEDIDGEANNIEALLIDTPGINGQKKNADLLTHRDRFPALGLPAAAIALYALQQFAPSGGAGNRTSLRGGGPMTTLVEPLRASGPTPLWRKILANLPLSANGAEYLADDELPLALPWLAPTLTSQGKPPVEISQADRRAHPLQAFFGMPRRIRLVSGGHGICPLTGEHGPLITGFVQKPWGINYGVWSHPLTPMRRMKPTDPPFTVKPKSARFGYREWVGAVIASTSANGAATMPAAPVVALDSRISTFRRDGYSRFRMLAAGWAMNNMEAGIYMQSLQPLYVSESDEAAEAFRQLAVEMARAGDAAASALRRNLKTALFGSNATVDTDSGVFSEVTDAFFERTEDAFHTVLDEVIHQPETAGDQQLRKRWLALLRQTALRLFDARASIPLSRSSTIGVAERVTEAYRYLRGGLSETGSIAEALGIDQPVRTAKTKKSRKTGDKPADEQEIRS